MRSHFRHNPAESRPVLVRLECGKGERYLQVVISGGQLCFIIFAVLCAVQGLLVFAFLRHLGPGIAGGVIEILIYTLLASYYYKNAKMPGI